VISATRPDYSNTPASPTRPAFCYQPVVSNAAPQATIVTPFYNTGEIFHETALSVMRQSFQQWEWLIVNDGTTDQQSLNILTDYRNRDPRIKVIDHEKNRGLPAARNTGFRLARTSYVVLLDSDDLLEPTAIEKFIWHLETHPECSFVTGYSVGFGATEYLWRRGFHNGSEFLRQNMVNVTTAVRKSVHEAVGGFNQAMRGGLEDWEFWLSAADRGYWGNTIPEYLDWYRRRRDHGDRWESLSFENHMHDAAQQVRARHAHLENSFPVMASKPLDIYPVVEESPPFENRLQKTKKRLLMVIPWMTLGGADKFNLDLVRQLRAQGWETTIVATLEGDNPWMPEFANETPDIFILPHFLKLTDWPRFISYLMDSRSIDHVFISNSDFAYSVLPYLRYRFPNVPFTDYCHMEEEYWKSGGYSRRAVESQQLLDMNLVSSQHLKRWMVGRGAEAESIGVCYTNIDSNEWKPLDDRDTVRRELSIGGDVPAILYAGRIHPQKQPTVFAGTMLRLRDSGARFIAVVAGDGPELPWLQNFVREHGLDSHVKLIGAVTNDRMKHLVPACDVFFLPSKIEGISLAIYEAMACGVAVVGADVGGQKELVTWDCGILIERSSERNEIDAYASALMGMISDPKRMRAMGEAGRRRIVESFELENLGLRIGALFASARERNRSNHRLPVNASVARSSLSMAVDYVRIENLLRSIWPVYSWTQRNRGNLEMMFPSDKPPALSALGNVQQPLADREGPSKLLLMEEAIYNFFAYLPERVLQAFLERGIAPQAPLLGDVLRMRRRILSRIVAWEREGQRVFIYGLGTHTQVLLGTLPTLMPLVRGFIDKKGGGSFLGLPCLQPEMITPENADVIIYSSKRWERDMYQSLAHLASIEHVLIYGDNEILVHAEAVAKPDAVRISMSDVRCRM